VTRKDYVIPDSLRARIRGREGKVLAKAWKRWRPPLKMTIAEWAKEFRRMPAGVTSEPGRYDPDRLPWTRFILDQISAGIYRDAVVVGAAQVMGKTEIMNCIVGYFIHADPAPILVKYPTEASAEGWSKAKFTPMIEATPVLRELIADPRSRDSGNTILAKRYPGGEINIVGANSPTALRQRSKRVVLQDEIDADEGSAGEEGDPCELADKRAESYPNAVKFKSSTPTIAGKSRCWKILENSTFHEWHAKCPNCGGHHVLAMKNLRWPKIKDAETGKVIGDEIEKAVYVCPSCSAEWDDIERQRAIMAGKPVARNPRADTFGFHVNGLYKLIGGKDEFSSMLEEFAFGFLKAIREGKEALKVWTNTFAAECWEESFDKLDDKEIIKRAEEYKPDEILPAGVLRIEGAADVQGDRIEAELIGYGEHEETWGLGYAVFHGDTETDAPWLELDKFIAKTFTHPSGKTLGAKSFFIDSGTKQDRIFRFTASRRARGVYACKGYSSPARPVPILPRRPSINNKKKVQQWIVGVTAAKTVLYDRVMLPVPGPGSMHFPKGYGYDERYFRQFASERRTEKKIGGRIVYQYDAGDRRNEPLDIRVYALAAHRRVTFNAEAIRAELYGAGGAPAPERADHDEGESAPAPERVGPSAKGMQFERAPVEAPAVAPSAPVVAVAPAPAVRPVASIRLPAYVPMHLRPKKA
jgi:phage terminase large subunit GpA-like protein